MYQGREGVTYSIKEVAERTGIPATTIRFYEKEGLLPGIKRTTGSRRQFDEKDMEWISTILCFLKTGMSLATVRRIVELAVQGDGTIPERKEILEQHKEQLRLRRQELEDAMRVVDKKLTFYASKINQHAADNW